MINQHQRTTHNTVDAVCLFNKSHYLGPNNWVTEREREREGGKKEAEAELLGYF